MLLATASEEIRLWNFGGDEESDKRLNMVRYFNPHHEQISKIVWTYDNSSLGSTCKSGKSIFLTSLDDEEVSSVKLEANDPPETCLAFNSSGRFVLSGSLNGKVAIYDVKKASMKRSYNPVKSGNSTTCVTFSPDDHCSVSGHKGGEIVLINIRSGQVYSPMYISGANSNSVASNGGTVQVLEFSRFNKTVLASGHSYGMVALWNTSHRIVSNVMDNHHRGPCMDLSFSPVNEMLLISCGLDRTIRCYDVLQASHVRSVETSHPLLCVSVARDGYSIAAGTSNGKVLMYDLRTLEAPVEILNAHTGPVSDLKFDNDPSLVVRNGSSETTSSTATFETARRSIVNSSIRKPLIEATNVESTLKAPQGDVEELKTVEESPVDESGTSSVNIYSVISPLASFNSTTSTTASIVSKLGDSVAVLPKLLENNDEIESVSLSGITESRGSKILKSVHFDDKEETPTGSTSESPIVYSHETPRPTDRYYVSTSSEVRDISMSSPRSPTASDSTSLVGSVGVGNNAAAATELSRIALDLRGDISKMRDDVNKQLFDWYAQMVWQLCVTENRIVNHVNKLLDDRESLSEEVERLRKENERLRKNF